MAPDASDAIPVHCQFLHCKAFPQFNPYCHSSINKYLIQHEPPRSVALCYILNWWRTAAESKLAKVKREGADSRAMKVPYSVA